jgi:hypothetical protein
VIDNDGENVGSPGGSDAPDEHHADLIPLLYNHGETPEIRLDMKQRDSTLAAV